MELRRRKYSEVSKQFILSVTDDKLGALKLSIEEFYKLKYCSTVVYMVPRA